MPKTLYQRQLAGPVCTLGVAGLLRVLESVGCRVPNPNLLFSLVVVWSAFIGGKRSGLASALIGILFTLVDWSKPGQFFCYPPETWHRLIFVLVCLPATAIMVGILKNRSELQRRTLEHFLAIERDRNQALAQALAQIEPFEGNLPVCAWCHRVREEDGTWQHLEAHLAEHYGIAVTHGICPDCRPAFFPETPR